MAEYIEREAVVHHFMTKRQYLTKDLVMDAAYEVSKFPAADVVPVVHGRWTFYSSYGEDEYEYECSVCNEWANQRYTYCPNCGAHMKDGE